MAKIYSFKEVLKDFVKKYNGPLITFRVTGGGISITNLCLIPGSSQSIYRIDVPYGEGCFGEALEGYKSVSKEVSQYLSVQNDGEEFLGVGITAALTTSRWRRGDNHAYISIYRPGHSKNEETWHLNIPKMREEVYRSAAETKIHKQREIEDQAVARIALGLIADRPAWFPKKTGEFNYVLEEC